jgi:hypothetical protein
LTDESYTARVNSRVWHSTDRSARRALSGLGACVLGERLVHDCLTSMRLNKRKQFHVPERSSCHVGDAASAWDNQGGAGVDDGRLTATTGGRQCERSLKGARGRWTGWTGLTGQHWTVCIDKPLYRQRQPEHCFSASARLHPNAQSNSCLVSSFLCLCCTSFYFVSPSSFHAPSLFYLFFSFCRSIAQPDARLDCRACHSSIILTSIELVPSRAANWNR